MPGDSVSCPYPSCSFRSTSTHGVDIHFAVVHNRQLGKRHHAGGGQNSRKQRRVSSELPANLGGRAPRLEVDRRTVEAFQQEEDDYAAIRLSDERFAAEIGISPSLDDHGGVPGEYGGAEAGDVLSQTFLLDLVALMSRIHRSVGGGLVDALLRLLRGHRSGMDIICQSVQSFSELMEFCKERISSALTQEGFSLATVKCAGGVQTTMYARDVVAVLREQVSRVHTCNVITRVVQTDTFSHVMNAELGVQTAPLVQHAVETCEDVGVNWKNLRRDGEQSFAGFLQLYSDKSQTSLKSGSFTLYPLHVTLLNLTEEARRQQIVSGRSIVAYLPVSLDGSDGLRCPTTSMSADEYRSLYRVVMHAAVEKALQPLREVCYPGFTCVDLDGARHRMHPVIGTYCADIPEACLALSVRGGNRTARPCHRCYVSKEGMPLYNKSVPRCIDDTSLCIRKKSAVLSPGVGFKPKLGERIFPAAEANILTALSVHVELPVLHDFPFMHLHPMLDIYSTFSFEPMHNLHLGVSRLLKDCATERLRSKTLFSSAILASDRSHRSFFNIRTTVLRAMNKFASTALRSAFGSSLRFNASSGRGGDLRGIFGRTGLVGMLEARDMRCIDQISPFLGAIMDRMCGEEQQAVITNSFVNYVDIVSSAYQRHSGKGWTKIMVSRLAKRIYSFKKHAVEVFGKFQVSGMGTPKWHLLDHLCEDIFRYGNIGALDACLFEFSHGPLKGDYRGGSCKLGSALQETVARFGDRAILQSMRDDLMTADADPSDPSPSGPPALGALRRVAAGDDGAKLSRGFIVLESFDLLRFVQDVAVSNRHLRSDKSWDPQEGSAHLLLRAAMSELKYPDFLFDFLRVVQFDGLRVFNTLLTDRLRSRGASMDRGDAVRLRFSNSAYVSGYPVPARPTSRGRGGGGSVRIYDSGRRFAQRVTAKASFYGSSEPRLDDVMLEGATDTSLHGVRAFDVWFGKVLQFVSVEYPESIMGNEVSHQDGLVRHSNGCFVEDMCFVQYYEVVTTQDLECDSVDDALGCVRLRWSRAEEEIIGTTPSKFYGLEPIDSIRGRVHVVPGAAGMEHLHASHDRRRALDLVRVGGEAWSGELFYVNRFAEEFGAPFDVGSI